MKHEIDEHTEASTEPSRAEAGVVEPPNTESLADEHARLAVEFEQASSGLDSMRAECSRLDNDLRERRHTDPFARAGERHRELLKQIPQLEAGAQTIADRLALLGKIEAFQRAVEEAPERAQAARQAMVMAEQRRDELTSRAEALRQRAEALRTESDTAEARAVEAETAVAQIYAKAISSGDAKAEKSARIEVEKAQAATAAVRAKVDGDARVITALELEAGALEQQAEAARGEAEEHRLCLFRAIETHLRSRWDLAVAKLAEVGARLRAAGTRIGTPSPFWQLRVGRFSPLLSWDLTEDELDAELSDDDLIAGVPSE